MIIEDFGPTCTCCTTLEERKRCKCWIFHFSKKPQEREEIEQKEKSEQQKTD